MDDITEERGKAIAKTIQPIGIQDLKLLGDQLFPDVGHPWRDALFQFIAENPAGTFYRAKTNDGIEIVYCRDKEKGLWFMPGSGRGIMQAKGLQILKEIVDAR